MERSSGRTAGWFGKHSLTKQVICCLAALGAIGLWALTSKAGGFGGPDVTVYDLNGVSNWGTSGGFRAYSIGTTSCNIGNAPLWWCNDFEDPYCEVNQHPVIAQNLYRLKDGRFEQIGMGWLKHGFLSLNQSRSECGDGSCDPPPFGNDQLGVGCTDPYGSGLNGSRPLGMRSEVNPTNGNFPYPYTSVGTSTAVDQRVQVAETDLDPTLNVGARYWVEGHYVAPDDAQADNGQNNASHREVAVTGVSRNLSFIAPTVRQVPAVFAWAAVDPATEIAVVKLGTRPEQFYNAGRNVSALGAGAWHYEYAIHNLNSSQGARAFTVQFPSATNFTNVGMHDVKHHSGEPYATTDWVTTVDAAAGLVSWSTSTYATDPNANALRWGTTFSFWFDADTAPRNAVQTLEMFAPGLPASVLVEHTGLFFQDGFESGTLSAWDASVP